MAALSFLLIFHNNLQKIESNLIKRFEFFD